MTSGLWDLNSYGLTLSLVLLKPFLIGNVTSDTAHCRRQLTADNNHYLSRKSRELEAYSPVRVALGAN